VDPGLYRWLVDVRRIFSADGGIDSGALDFAAVSLSDLGEHAHDQLSDIRQATPGPGTKADGHLSDAQLQSISDGIAQAVAASTGVANKLRSFDGSGAPLDITVSQALDKISATPNVMLVRTSTGWTVIAPPTVDGQYLRWVSGVIGWN